MTNYEKLIDRIEYVLGSYGIVPLVRTRLAPLILAEVLRTLEKVTPEMERAADPYDMPDNAWLDMLHASALSPP